MGHARRLAALFLVIALAACPGNGGNGDGDGDPDPAILAMEDDAFDQINAQRVANNVAALILDEEASDVARAHSQDMVDREFFAHVNPDGDDPFDRMEDGGVVFGPAAENLAFNQGFADPVTTAVNGWINSPGHFTNLMNPDYTHTGMGVAGDAIDGFFFTQVFFAPAKSGVPEIHIITSEPIALYAD